MTCLHQFNLDGLNIVDMPLGTATTFDRLNMHEKRRLERKYRKSGLTVDKQLFEDKCLEMYQPSRTLRSASHSLRCPQKAKTENCGCRALSFVAPKSWNSLPEDIKNAKTVICFKNKLQTHLFRNAFLF